VRIDYSFVRRASIGLLSWKDRKEKKERQKDKRLIFFFFFLFFFLFNLDPVQTALPPGGRGLGRIWVSKVSNIEQTERGKKATLCTMASLLFVCPKTNQRAPTGIEADVQSLSAS
jgi:hypothetical protein